MTDPIAAYERRREELRGEQAAFDARSSRISALRGVTFLLAAGVGLVAGLENLGSIAWAVAAVSAVAFVALVIVHAILVTRATVVAKRIALVERGLARARGVFESLPDRGDRFAAREHPYAHDLDLFGSTSLFQLVSAAETGLGEARLARWLLEPASASEIRERQAAAKELASLPRFLEELALAAKASESKGREREPLIGWAEGRASDALRSVFAKSIRYLSLITFAALVAGETWGHGLVRHAWIALTVVQLFVLVRLREATNDALRVASDDEPFGRYVGLFRVIEQQTFTCDRLASLRARLAGTTGSEASSAIGDLAKILGYAELRRSGIVYLFANPVLLCDVWCGVALDRWRELHGRRVAAWIDDIATMEALASLGAFAAEHPSFAFPEVHEGATIFEADALAHPLLPEAHRVANDVSLASPGHALLVTGSNMSGKSTMLRAMGVAAVLGLAGAPVCAKRLVLGELAVRTSMRISDSLERGVSHFYAEIARLKSITTSVDAGERVFFLLDEILHGTNSRERLAGARSVLLHLVAHGAIGAVSSHDLGLTPLAEETNNQIVNVHFEESMNGKELAFDYLLKQGVVETTNALRLMRELGLPVD